MYILPGCRFLAFLWYTVRRTPCLLSNHGGVDGAISTSGLPYWNPRWRCCPSTASLTCWSCGFSVAYLLDWSCCFVTFLFSKGSCNLAAPFPILQEQRACIQEQRACVNWWSRCSCNTLFPCPNDPRSSPRYMVLPCLLILMGHLLSME